MFLCLSSLIWLLSIKHCFEGRKKTQPEKNCIDLFFFLFKRTSKSQSSLFTLVNWLSHLRNKKGTGVEMCLAIVPGIVTGDMPVSYWPIFSLSLVTVPKDFAKVNWAQFHLVSKVMNDGTMWKLFFCPLSLAIICVKCQIKKAKTASEIDRIIYKANPLFLVWNFKIGFALTICFKIPLRFKLFHNIQKVIVHLWLVSKLKFDLIQVWQGILHLTKLIKTP